LLLLASEPALALLGDKQGRTALHIVAELGWADVVHPLMLAAPEAATEHDHSGSTPLIAAHRRQQAAAARALVLAAAGEGISLRAGLERLLRAAVDQNDKGHLTALLWTAAVECNGCSAPRSVLDDVLNDIGLSLLRTAVTRFDADASVALLLLEAAPWLTTRADSNGQGPLHWLIASWEERMCGQALLQQLVDSAPAQVAATLAAATGQQTPLQLAVDQRRWVAVVQLLEAVMQASNDDGQDGPAIALQMLLQAAHGPAELALIMNGQRGVLQAAVERPTAAVLQLLLSAQLSDVMETDDVGRLPLHVAAMHGSADAVRLLLAAAPAAASAEDDYGSLPLHLAALYGRPDAVRLLLAASPAAAAAEDFEGLLPLHTAVKSGNAAAVSLLLEAAPRTAATATRCGWLPLHYAARQGDATVVQLLLGALPQAAVVASPSGETPLGLAYQRWHAESVRILMRHGSTQDLLGALAAARPRMAYLCADVVAARLPLNATEWTLVPSPCPGLGHALPAALQHSPEQVRQLVQHTCG
jgi:ankyrin repeat protein